LCSPAHCWLRTGRTGYSFGRTLSRHPNHARSNVTNRIPFYPWIRLSFLLYLVLPQTQGAKLVYIEYIHPFLHAHEGDIESFIARSLDQARAAVLQYYRRFVEYVRETFLGVEPRPQPRPTRPAATQSTATYVQTLLSRFNLPAAATPPAGDIYSYLSSALSLQQSSTVTTSYFPPWTQPKQTNEERLTFITTQRDRLYSLLQSLDREALNLSTSSLSPEILRGDPSGGIAATSSKDQPLKKSKSELEFERVEREDIGEETRAGSAGGWMPWNWGGRGGAAATVAQQPVEDMVSRGMATGRDADMGGVYPSSVQQRQGRGEGHS
jgi:receptor expression-enhancing protein 1/2/3/4